jgi:hypothetical protein
LIFKYFVIKTVRYEDFIALIKSNLTNVQKKNQKTKN